MQQFHKLEHLFKDELKNFNPKLTINEIDFLDKFITKNNFYKFNPYHFNLFYAMAIVSGFLITMSLAGHYLYSQALVNQPTSLPIAMNPASKQMKFLTQNNKIIVANKPNVTKKNIALKTIKKQTKHNHQNTPNTNNPLIINYLRIDTSSTINESPNAINSKTNTVRKLVYITQKDTIFQIDTIRTLKKNKWFSKNQ
jgi:hypothetical protein